MAGSLMERTSIAGIAAGARTLIIAAHADDEMLGAGGWLARRRGQLALTVLTGGVPPDRRHFPSGQTNRVQYGRTRRLEVRRVWRRFAPGARLYLGPFSDPRLHLELDAAADWLARVAAAVRPDLVLAP
ncbi:MAG: PIG-L deacetylase family protein, partial [Streptosporangiaceae bacterium]